ncbi:MAG: nucleotide-binding protein [Methanocorpusculum sp.]|nr:nucleotide-binding protein [Methanocorpusculum sp.]
MKIHGVTIGISPLHILVVVFFLVLFAASYLATSEIMYLLWGIPLSLVLLIIPIFNSYSVGSQYIKLLPEYEEQSKRVRIKQINLTMLGKPVRVEGVVQAVKGVWLCRPALTIFDGSAAIVVKKSAPLEVDVAVGDNVEIVGMTVRRFAIFGDVMVHAIGVKKVENLTPLEEEESAPAEEIRIKKY